MTDPCTPRRAGLRLLRWMDRRWVVISVLVGGLLLGFFVRVGPEGIGRTTAELWIPLAFGALALVAAVMAGYADGGERRAEARYEAFQRALAERERRDASESARDSADRNG